MKTIYCCFLLIVIIFSDSCSKKNDTTTASSSITIQVVEYKTESPIVGASVEYFTPCPLCAIQPALNRVFSSKTVFDGKCDVPESIFNNTGYGIVITPPSPPQTTPPIDYYYWPTGSPAVHSSAKKYVLPVTGDERLHLLKINDFPKGHYMKIFAQGELASFQVIDVAYINGFPADSTFDFYTYKGQTN